MTWRSSWAYAAAGVRLRLGGLAIMGARVCHQFRQGSRQSESSSLQAFQLPSHAYDEVTVRKPSRRLEIVLPHKNIEGD
jgi:hypothetical protein